MSTPSDGSRDQADENAAGTPDWLAKPGADQPAPEGGGGWPGYAGQGGHEEPTQAGPPPASPSEGQVPPPPAGPGYQAYGPPQGLQGGQGYPGYAPQPGYGYGYAAMRPSHQGANTALGLGIASLVCAVLVPFCCLTVVGIPIGPFAIGLALKARRDFRAHPGAYRNEGAATAGLICGIIGTALGLLMVLAVLLFFGFAIGVGSLG